MERDLVVLGFTLALLVGIPLLTVDEASLEGELTGPDRRRAVYLSGTASLVLMAGLTLLVAAWRDVPAAELAWRAGPLDAALAWAVGTTVAGLASATAAAWIFERLGLRESRLALFLMPRTRSERWLFLLLALAAGVCEEYVYRGMALHAVIAWTGSPEVAVVVTAVSFGLAHGYQRLAGVVRATILGVLLAVPVLVTDSLFPAVIAHFWMNAVIGLGGWRWMISGSERRGPGAGP